MYLFLYSYLYCIIINLLQYIIVIMYCNVIICIMNKFAILLVLLLIVESNKLLAQVDSSQFLLRNFEKGQVFFKDGRVFDASLNYSLFVKKFLFQDQQDKKGIYMLHLFPYHLPVQIHKLQHQYRIST